MAMKTFQYENVDSRIEEYKLTKCEMFNNRGFMALISDSNDNVIFEPYMISNFSIDNKNIFVTIYDLVQPTNIEETLDGLTNGLLWFRENLKVTLIRLDSKNGEVYRTIYSKCKLKKYHGKNFTYKGNDKHQWYLELNFKKKEIVKNKDFNFLEVMSGVLRVPTQEELSKSHGIKFSSKSLNKEKEAKILMNSNKMLNDAAETVRKTNRLNEKEKVTPLKQIDEAKKENEQNAIKYLDTKLDYNKLEKDIINELNQLEII